MDTWILTATAGYCHDDECHEHPIPSETSPCRDPEITTRQLAPNRPCAQSWRQISTSIQCLARCDQRTQPANVPEWQHYNVTHEVQVMDPFVARERRYRSSPNRLLYSLSARTGVPLQCPGCRRPPRGVDSWEPYASACSISAMNQAGLLPTSQCCLLVPRSPSKPVMLTFDLQSRKV